MDERNTYDRQRLNRIARRDPGVRCVLDALNRLNREVMGGHDTPNISGALSDLRAAAEFFRQAAAKELDDARATVSAYNPRMLAEMPAPQAEKFVEELEPLVTHEEEPR